jgi:predicted GNAT family acetyltransferase
MTEDHRTPEITENAEEQRYEARLADGRLAGFLTYERAENLISLNHTEVDDALEGRGIGSTLARAALDRAREASLTVRPVCPFVSAWISKHPDYQDLTAEQS